MQTSPSLDHNRIARAAILNGVTIPATTVAVLEARGIDVGELEHRIHHEMSLSLRSFDR